MSAGCQGALGLDDYIFASAGAGGMGGTAGTNGRGGSAGDGGSGGAAGAGGDGAAGSGGASLDAGADGGAGHQPCGDSGRCVPPIPVGWQGPIVVGATGAGCPSSYPTALGEVHTDFQAGAANCSCTCVLTGVSCRIRSSTGDLFEPAGSCDTPPVEDDCLSAASVATCSPASTLSDITASAFQTTQLSCGGAVAQGACSGGSCYASGGDFGSVCVSAIGDIACPSGFPEREVYFQDVMDGRSCGCSCAPQGQVCQIEIEVCSVGFYQETLTEGNECTQLGSSDGQDVTLLSTAVLQQGSCGSAGLVQGSTAPIDPITVCCMD